MGLPEKHDLQKPEKVEGTFSYEDFGFRSARIKKSVNESPTVKSFYLENPLRKDPLPGQFVMVWVPGGEEIPISISGVEDDALRISVANKGKTTAKLHALEKGGTVMIRGPFGTHFHLNESSYLLVGGGYGVAPLIYAASFISKSGTECTYLVGAKTASELLFLEEARRLGMDVRIITEDGSAGRKGMVTDVLDKLLEEKRFDLVLTCGPERMMYEVVRKALGRGIRVQASLERYMKCGFGICGSCVLDPTGLRVCTDGPVFDGEVLLSTDFGRKKRDASGSVVEI